MELDRRIEEQEDNDKLLNETGDNTYPPNRFAKSTASSLENADSSPVNTNDKPAKQSGEAGSGTAFEPGAAGPARRAAFMAAQLGFWRTRVVNIGHLDGAGT